jgi:hypothetical protein
MRSSLPWLIALVLVACNRPRTADQVDPCGPADDVEQAVDTTGSAAKTGGTTAWEGLKTAGKAVGGLVDGGKHEARKEWEAGKERTRDTARKGADETKETATSPPPCDR